ncbi:MAG: cation transporter [Collinsella sp.]
MKKQFKLDEIDCANCARELQDELAKLEGVKSVSGQLYDPEADARGR